MDGTCEQYAKWNKPGGEGQIPYDLTFNWNIINKTKLDFHLSQYMHPKKANSANLKILSVFF